METVYLIIALVWSVLVIILFFKVWGMTNNVAKILEVLEGKQNPEDSGNNIEQQLLESDSDNSPIEVGTVVYCRKDGREMIVERCYAGQYYCVDPTTRTYIATYNHKDISIKMDNSKFQDFIMK